MALISTIADSFNNNSISGIWDTSLSADSSQVSESNNQIQITHTASIQYNALSTATTYDLTSSSSSIGITNIGNQALASHEVIFEIYSDGSNDLWFTISGNNLSAFKKVVGVQLQVGSSIAYSSTNHRYLRFRESAGTVYWDTSDGVTWTNQWSLLNPFGITAIKMVLESGCYANEASSSLGYFDNFNILPQIGMSRHLTLEGDGMSRSEAAT